MARFDRKTYYGWQQFDIGLQCRCGHAVLMIKRWKATEHCPVEWVFAFMEQCGGTGASFGKLIHRLRSAWWGLLGRDWYFQDLILGDEEVRELIGYAKEQWEEGGN